MTKNNLYVPVLPYPSKCLVYGDVSYDITTELPFILEIEAATVFTTTIDTVWGVEGFLHGTTIILPTSLYECETAALRALRGHILLRTTH